MKLKNTLSKIAALSTLALAAGVANAEIYNFTITGDYTASWQMDSALVPDISAPGEGIIYFDVAGGTFEGAVSEVVDLTFYAAAGGGGLGIEDYYEAQLLLVADGPQLYSGVETAPVFNIGSYALTEYQGTGTYTLTISAVPEPASIALMLAGLGLVGAAARRKRN